MTKLSFIIPCYRSELTITKVVEEIIETVQTRPAYDYEIILINDHSPDHVYEVIKKLAKANPKIKGLSFAMNFGQHSALMAGFNVASGDIVVCLDDDGQTPANEMFTLLDKLEEGYDIVYAKYEKKKHGFVRNAGSKVNDLMAKHMVGKPQGLYLCSYFVCRRFIIDQVIEYRNAYPYVAGLLLRCSRNATNVMVTHRNREIGQSGYNMKKLISLWFNGFTAFSIKPLRVATFIGSAFSVLGFLYGIVIIINKFMNPATPLGYSSMMTAIIFIGGMIMLMLGLVGEYVGRIYISINNAPQYVIKDSCNLKPDRQ
jgi:undecaprenyl-phosphate 4-deoxy-4-formamido-L-arabinose transferase